MTACVEPVASGRQRGHCQPGWSQLAKVRAELAAGFAARPVSAEDVQPPCGPWYGPACSPRVGRPGSVHAYQRDDVCRSTEANRRGHYRLAYTVTSTPL